MWYKQYGWDSNPFLVKYSVDLVGLEKEKKLLQDYVNSGDICIITGASGVGKTSLLKWLEHSLRKYKMIYLNAEGVSEYFNLTKFVKKGFFRKRVLLVDEAHYCDENFRKELKLLWDSNALKSVVIAQPVDGLQDYSESFRNRVGKRSLSLRGMGFEETKQLLDRRTSGKHPFSAEILTQIVDEAKNNPRTILENCELACIELQGQEFSYQNVKRVLDGKKADELANLIVLEEPKLPDHLVPADEAKLQGYSPMQKRLILLLLEGNRTAKQLSSILSTTEGSVGKQLSILNDMKVIAIVNHRRPKVYGLTSEFKSSLH